MQHDACACSSNGPSSCGGGGGGNACDGISTGVLIAIIFTVLFIIIICLVVCMGMSGHQVYVGTIMVASIFEEFFLKRPEHVKIGPEYA
jgi:hypothetical protein